MSVWTVTIVLYNTIENNTKYTEQKKYIYIENNYYLLCMHAVFTSTTTASCNGDGGEESLPSDGVWETRSDK